MYCPECGKKNPESAYYCLQCGQTLPSGSGAQPVGRSPTSVRPGRRSSSTLLIGLVGGIAAVLVVMLLALLALLLLQRPEKELVESTVESVRTAVLIVVETPPTSPSPEAGNPGPVEATPQDTARPPTATPPGAGATPPEVSPTATLIPGTPAAPALTASAPETGQTEEAPPTARPPAQPRCRYAERGVIGFRRQQRCDARSGNACGPVEIWVMDGDGSNQAPMCNTQAYQWGLVRDRTSPDGAWRVEVSDRPLDIYRLWLDTGRKEMIIVNNRKDWDPVLSADGWWLAWVTNRNANDEIYIKTLDPGDQNQRRLTQNDWEWDKHPTWSPDGRRIAFYSNRADKLSEATRQIWVMEVVNDRGTNLRNLSKQPGQVDSDPVWFKWEGIPR